MNDRRFNVLISAYACEPGKGSEPEVGWQWVTQMARFHNVTVLTRENNRPGIEADLAAEPDGAKPRFIYYDLDPILLRLKRRFHLTHIYYALWQRDVWRIISDLLRREHFDLLHHVTFATFRFPTAIWDHGVPCVWGPIGGVESIPLNLLPWRYPRSLASELSRNLDNLIHTATVPVLQRRARHCSIVLTSTRQMQNTFSDLGVRTLLMPTIGLHTHQFPAPVRQPSNGALRLLYAGNLLPLKGLDFALRALKASGTTAQFTLIGSGLFQQSLKKLAARLGVSERVEFRGRLSRDKMLNIYKDFDVFFFPSLHDTGSYALIEAMCNAMPVICLATGGPDTAVQDGGGIRVPLGSRTALVAGLAEAVRFYDGDRQKIIEDGKIARRSVELNYDWVEKGNLMNAFYHRAVRGNP